MWNDKCTKALSELFIDGVANPAEVKSDYIDAIFYKSDVFAENGVSVERFSHRITLSFTHDIASRKTQIHLVSVFWSGSFLASFNFTKAPKDKIRGYSLRKHKAYNKCFGCALSIIFWPFKSLSLVHPSWCCNNTRFGIITM